MNELWFFMFGQVIDVYHLLSDDEMGITAFFSLFLSIKDCPVEF